MKKVIAVILSSLFTLASCKPKTEKEIITYNSKEIEAPTKIVVVKKIALTYGKHQSFIVSGDNFKFRTKELTFVINDTIVLQGEKAYPIKNKRQKIEIKQYD